MERGAHGLPPERAGRSRGVGAVAVLDVVVVSRGCHGDLNHTPTGYIPQCGAIVAQHHRAARPRLAPVPSG
ncbi:hypothetical protein GCM10027517_29390 [Phycicoccus ginsengisoli]